MTLRILYSLSFLLLLLPARQSLAQMTVNVEVFQVRCHGDNTGRIIIEPSGGAPPYRVSINNQPFGFSLRYEFLSAGRYDLFVMDADGAEYREAVEIAQPEALRLASLEIVEPSECNAADGSIAVTSEGGLGRYEYRLGNGGRVRDSLFVGLAAGSYNLTIYDQANCRTDTLLSLADAASDIEISATVFSPACHDYRDGEIFAEVEGGAEPYEYSLDGVDYSEVPEFTGLAGGRAYTLFVRDFNGCVRTQNIDIPAPAPLSMELVGYDPECGQDDGAVEVVGRGGTRPYQFSLDGIDYQSRPRFDNLPPGLYVVSMIDTNDCILTDTVRLEEEIDLEIDLEVKHPGCALSPDGVVTVQVEGGETPYAFTLNDTLTQEDNVFTDLDAGFHTVVVEDARGCRDERQIELVYLPDIAFDLELAHPTCLGEGEDDEDGVIRIVNARGDGPLRFSPNGLPGSFQEDSVFTGLGGGVYFVYALDANNCVLEEIVFLRRRSDLGLTFELENPSCGGGGSGAIVVNASNGAAPYVYSLDGLSYRQENRFDDVEAGEQVVYCIDAEQCEDWDTVRLDAPGDLEAELEVEHASCPDVNDGSVNIEISGGTPPYRFALGDTSQPIRDLQSDKLTIFDIAPGAYQVSLLDAAGCITVLEFEIEAPEIELLTLDPTCENNDGEILVSVLGAGEREVRYQLRQEEPDTSGAFTGLPGGTYTVKVYIGEDCVAERETELETAPFIQAELFPTAPSACGAEDGSIRVEAEGGLGELRYSLDAENWQDSPFFSDLADGNYTVYVEDGYSCRIALQIELASAGNNIRLTFVTEDSPCFGEPRGSARLNAVAGTEPYEYAWPDDDTRSERDDLPAGEYVVTVTDANGCAKTDTIRIGEPEEIVVELSIECIFDIPGYIFLSVEGGTPPYAYALAEEDTVWQSESEIGTWNEGPFTALVRDDNGCIVSYDSTMCVETSRKQLLAEGSFALYPNPADGDARVRAELARPATLEFSLYDLQGRKLRTFDAEAKPGDNDIPVDLTGLTTGAYLLKISAEGRALQTIKVMLR